MWQASNRSYWFKNDLMSAPQRRTAARTKRTQPAVDLHDPTLYINRELSLLKFQRRVLEEAQNPDNPLLERVKFLAIVDSNLDEIFMVRVAALREQAEAGILEFGPDRMSPSAQLIAMRREIRKLFADSRKCLAELRQKLDEEGIHIKAYKDLSESEKAVANAYFRESIFPVLTPLAFDPGRPFPLISNLSLNLGVSVRHPSGVSHFARVKVPEKEAQFVLVSKPGGKRRSRPAVLAPIEEVIAANLASLFPGLEVLEAHPFHVTRDADLDIKELEAADLLETVEESIRQRRFGEVTRLCIMKDMPQHMLEMLKTNLELDRAGVYRTDGLLALSRLMGLYALDRPDLKYPPFVPAIEADLGAEGEEADLFAQIRKGDILLHHPYDSFQPVVDFLHRAAHDANVLAIKIVLYRVGRNSPVVAALLDAIEEGKQVAVLMELKARFDEESNIEWARALERAGVHVVYGLLGLKSHCKVALVVRREGDRIRRYAHLATGNYNAVTAHLYTDIGMFTADEDITADASDVFNYLTGYSLKQDYRKLLVSPVNLRRQLEALIKREIEHQANGRNARLILKMNSLVDGRMIRLLYEASTAGVQCDLLVRGICCLRPGLPGVSENIRVISIVGRFLEHSRVFYFSNGGAEEIYLGSADLMPRNLDRRVEVLFPLRSRELRKRVKEEILDRYLSDNVKARIMLSDGSYVRPKRNKQPVVDAQAKLLPKAPGPLRPRATVAGTHQH